MVCSVPGTVPRDILKVNTYKLELRIFSPKALFLASHSQRHPHPFRGLCQELGIQILDTSLFSQLPHIKPASSAISLKHILNLSNFPHNHYLHTRPMAKPLLSYSTATTPITVNSFSNQNPGYFCENTNQIMPRPLLVPLRHCVKLTVFLIHLS